ARELFKGEVVDDWLQSFYYHYYAHYSRARSVWGVRTADWKLINHYMEDSSVAQQMFHLSKDPQEIENLVNNPEFAEKKQSLEQQVEDLQAKYELTDELLEQIYAKPGELISIPKMRKEVKALRAEIDANTERLGQ
ncbi:MAG: sulfatase/phosphatase domain-containing protein, partial [Verrucomicrobiota bacterium]